MDKAIVIENVWKLAREGELSSQVQKAMSKPYTHAGIERVSLLATVPFVYDPRQGRLVHLGERVEDELRTLYHKKGVTLQRGHYQVGLDGNKNIVSMVETIVPEPKHTSCYDTLEETRVSYNREKGKF